MSPIALEKALKSMLAKYSAEEIKTKILVALPETETRLRQGIIAVMDLRPDLSLEALSHQLLGEARRAIDEEKSRYQMDELG